MSDLQEQCDDAILDFTTGDCEGAIVKLKKILEVDPNYFDAQLALTQAYYASGDYASAIAEGHKAEKMKPSEQLVHTNLSRAYMKMGDKKTAEHHGLQARIADWKANMSAPVKKEEVDELAIAKPAPAPVKIPEKFPDMPWKKKKEGAKPDDHGHSH